MIVLHFLWVKIPEGLCLIQSLVSSFLRKIWLIWPERNDNFMKISFHFCFVWLDVKYFQMFGLTNKIFQVNHKNPWFKTKVVGAISQMTGLMELIIRVVVLAIGLPTITIEAISLVTKPSTPIDKTMSLATRPLALVAVWLLWPLDCKHWSLVWRL